MNTNEAIAFAETILPWIEERTGMKRNGMQFPRIEDVGDLMEFIVPSGIPGMVTGAAYSPVTNWLLFNGSSEHDPLKMESVIVHEMTHWLQGANGKLDDIDHRASELEAYQTQATYIMSKGKHPDDYGLTWQHVAKASGIEQALAYQIPSDAIDV